jgi:hypothetical protein
MYGLLSHPIQSPVDPHRAMMFFPGKCGDFPLRAESCVIIFEMKFQI